MKVNIWIKKEDVKKGVITEYHTNQPQISYSSYVQVSITSDEYVQLDDKYDPIDRDPADSIECCDKDHPCECGMEGQSLFADVCRQVTSAVKELRGSTSCSDILNGPYWERRKQLNK